MRSTSQHVSILWMLAAGCLFAGCSEDVNPLVDEERPFTVYGYLDPSSSLQKIRVIPIARRIDEPFEEAIDAGVVSIDLQTGEQRVWRHTVATYESGEKGHVFRANFMPEYGRSYRVEIARSDGAVSTVEITTPVRVNVVPPPPDNNSPTLTYFIEAEDRPNIVQADMDYLAAAIQPFFEPGPILYPVNVSYRGKETRQAGGWKVDVDLQSDYQTIEAEFDRNCLTTEYIKVRSMHFEVFIGDDAWTPPGNVFDEDVLSQPELFTNVGNGYGFFGAGYSIRYNAIQPGGVLVQAGFAEADPCVDVPLDHPSCRVIPPCFQD